MSNFHETLRRDVLCDNSKSHKQTGLNPFCRKYRINMFERNMSKKKIIEPTCLNRLLQDALVEILDKKKLFFSS